MHQHGYEKDLKRIILQERANKFELKQDLDKEKTEQEVREYLARSTVDVAAQPKEKGKGILQGPASPSLCRIEDTLDKGVELYLIEKEKREEEAREHVARSTTAVGSQSNKKGTGVLQG